MITKSTTLMINKLKELTKKYSWAGALLGFALGFFFGPGLLWNLLDFHLKRHSATIEQLKIEKEFYDRIQEIQSEISALIPSYISLQEDCDSINEQYPTADHPGRLPTQADNDIKVKFISAKEKLQSLIAEHNRLELMLHDLTGEKPQIIDESVIPTPPSKLQSITITHSP